MRAYDATCPHCGHRNNDMYLEETEGWMECEACGKLYAGHHLPRTSSPGEWLLQKTASTFTSGNP